MAASIIHENISDINLRKLCLLTSNTSDTIAWCRRQGLLAINITCPSCGRLMKETTTVLVKVGFRWRLVLHSYRWRWLLKKIDMARAEKLKVL